MPDKEEKKDIDLGFGYFSTPEKDGNWRHRSYDGIDNLESMNLSQEFLVNMIRGEYHER